MTRASRTNLTRQKLHLGAFGVIIIAMLFIPFVSALVVERPEAELDTYIPATVPFAREVEETPWWETTTMDSDGDKVFDLLNVRFAQYPTWPVYVNYDREITENDITALEALGCTVTYKLLFLNAVGLDWVSPATVKAITQLDGVVMVEPKGIPELYGDVQSMNIKARESDEYSPNTAWELGYRGEGIAIAVVDTGVDNAHPSFRGKWLGGADISKPETFLTPRDGSYDADDTNGHGTSCTGMAMGTGAPEGKYMGSAPDARLVDVRIGTMIGYAPGEILQKNFDASLEGIEWSISHKDDQWAGAPAEYAGIDIVSLSWGIDVGGSTDGSDIYSRILDTAMDAGVAVVNAAGNSGPNNDGFSGFAASDLSITIASSDDDDTVTRDDDFIASYSSRGPRKDDGDQNEWDELIPDVAAPGTHIVQAMFDRFGDASNNGYQNRGSGTSYATPSAAGIVALMMEANPNLDVLLIKEILQMTATRMGEASEPDKDPFWNRDFGYGLTDGYEAVKMALEIEEPGLIDVRLQCHITNTTAIENNSAPFMVTGYAWGQGVDVEDVFYRIDGGQWKVATIDRETKWGEFTVNVKPGSLKEGEHTLEVMTSAGGYQSLIDSMTFNSIEGDGAGAGGMGGGSATIIIVLVVVGVAAAAAAGCFIFWRKSKMV